MAAFEQIATFANDTKEIRGARQLYFSGIGAWSYACVATNQ